MYDQRDIEGQNELGNYHNIHLEGIASLTQVQIAAELAHRDLLILALSEIVSRAIGIQVRASKNTKALMQEADEVRKSVERTLPNG